MAEVQEEMLLRGYSTNYELKLRSSANWYPYPLLPAEGDAI